MKKRILSLILALSMVLSVLPLGAFAEGSLPELVMGATGYPVCSNGTQGNGWEYMNGTLYLDEGTYDFSSTHPQDTTKGDPTTKPVQCPIKIKSSSATITGGTFEKKVTNNAGGTISGGIFQRTGSVTNEGANATIENGTFNGKVTNNAGGIISGGTFQDTCSVTNSGTIKKGTFKDVCSVTNEGANATIENGTFKNMCRVTNNSTIENGTFKDMCSVENNGTINNGTFTYKVENNGIITGGVFNRNANLTGVTGGYNITVASNAKIEKVNGVSADWAPYVVTSNAMPTTKEVTITADTEIFSLNGQPIGDGNCNSSYGSDKTTVTFTMPDDKDVVLNEEINYGDLVMENG